MAGTVHDVENKALLTQVRQEAADAAQQLMEASHLRKGQIVVVGCSTSEVVGKNVGSWSTPEVAAAIFEGLHSVFGPAGVYIAAQCCEHLNRALIVEHEAVPDAEIVNVKPQPKAGSSFATAAYNAFRHPVALEEIRADAGLDIGGTLIGMHLKQVAVPVRLQLDHIGSAILLAAPAWASGTALGIVAGNLLPLRAVSALSVALYGMFLAIIIPPARKDKVVAMLVAISFALSFACNYLPGISALSDGTRTILLTVLISSAAAVLFPVKDQEAEHDA